MSTVIDLKIKLHGEDIVKELQVDVSASVEEASLTASKHLLDQEDPEDYGLMLPGTSPSRGVWLDPSASMRNVRIKSGATLVLRRRKRLLRVKTLDGTLATLMVDESLKVSDLIKQSCAKIGVKNAEEYSFVTEASLAKQSRLSLRSSKRFKPLKRKLSTQIDVCWLDQNKTIREYCIEEQDVLVLRKRYIFSEESADGGSDPKEVHLMYVEARDAVLAQTHPVTKASAVQLGALQCQIEYGDWNREFAKPGFLALPGFVPADYIKSKNIESKIIQEYEKSCGLSEGKAKQRYIQLCRSLKTYGVTFFLVKEKLKGRNKLVPRLLGITCECIMTLDQNTKEVLTTWPLTSVRRWANTGSTFSLDLGGYSGSLYSVQTAEGDAISHLISGYIDRTLKRQQSTTYSESDQESVDSSSMELSGDFSLDSPLPVSSKSGLFGINQDLEEALTVLASTASLLNQNTPQKSGVSTVVSSVFSPVVAVMASAASILLNHQASPGDSVKVGAALKTLSVCLAALPAAVQSAVARSDHTEDAGLSGAAVAFTAAVEGLLSLVQSTGREEGRHELEVAVTRVGQAGQQLIQVSGELSPYLSTQKTLASATGDISRRTGYLSKLCLSMVADSPSQESRAAVGRAVSELGGRSEALAAVVAVLCPVLTSPLAQEVVASAVSRLARASENLCALLQPLCEDDESMSSLAEAGGVLIEDLEGLINEVTQCSLPAMCHLVETSLAGLLQSASLVAENTSAVDTISEAKKINKCFDVAVSLLMLQSQRDPDPSTSKSLLDLGKAITRASLGVIEAAKLLTSSEQPSLAGVRAAGSELVAACRSANLFILSQYSERRVVSSASTACDVCSPLLAAVERVVSSEQGEWRAELTAQCETSRRRLFALMCLLTKSSKSPVRLREYADQSLALANSIGRLLAGCKASIPAVKDLSSAQQLSYLAKASGSAIGELRRAAKKSSVVVQRGELDSCVDQLEEVDLSSASQHQCGQVGSISAALQALKSSRASVCLSLKNGDSTQLVASLKDHAHNMQVWCGTVGGSAAMAGPGRAGLEEQVSRAVQTTKDLLCTVREGLLSGTSLQGAEQMVEQGWQVITATTATIEDAEKQSQAPTQPKEKKRPGCLMIIFWAIVGFFKALLCFAWRATKFALRLLFKVMLVVFFPLGLCYLCFYCCKRLYNRRQPGASSTSRSKRIPHSTSSSSSMSLGSSDESSDDDYDYDEDEDDDPQVTVTYRSPQASKPQSGKLKEE